MTETFNVSSLPFGESQMLDSVGQFQWEHQCGIPQYSDWLASFLAYFLFTIVATWLTSDHPGVSLPSTLRILGTTLYGSWLSSLLSKAPGMICPGSFLQTDFKKTTIPFRKNPLLP